MYEIYKISNSINDKLYIGITKNGIEKRFKGHCKNQSDVSFITRAILKYGKENFSVEVIEVAETIELAYEKEIYWIKELNTVKPNGYNISEGGPGSNIRKENQTRKYKNTRFKNISDEARRNGALKRVGIPRSEETKNKISASSKGRPQHPNIRIGRIKFDSDKEKVYQHSLSVAESKRKSSKVNKKTGYKGVYFDGRKVKNYFCKIYINNKIIYSKYFLTAFEAALEYDRIMFIHFGFDCYLNYPDEIIYRSF